MSWIKCHTSKHFHQNTSITVEITCNQIIERSDTYMYPYTFASSFPLNIRLIGHNNASISVKDMAYLTIDQESESEFNWAWIGFTIFTRIRGIIWHVNMNSLVIRNCKIMTTQLKSQIHVMFSSIAQNLEEHLEEIHFVHP